MENKGCTSLVQMARVVLYQDVSYLLLYKTISRLIIEGFIINGFVWQRDFMLYVLFQRRMVQSILLSGVQNPMNLLLSMDVSKLY